MTGMQAAIAAGALLALGAVLVVAWALPSHPDLADTLTRLSPHHGHQPTDPSTITPDGSVKERIGVWALRRLPGSWWRRAPARDLALLRIPVQRYYGEKFLYVVLGLLIPPLLTGLFRLFWLDLPLPIPVVASLALAVFMWFIPDIDARSDAKAARADFRRTLAAYVDLVALERSAGSGPRPSLEMAAGVGDSWVFRRIGEELARSRYNGVAPWDALAALAEDLAVPDLDDLAGVMRHAGEDTARVYSALRARSAAMRSAMLADDLAKANATGVRMNIPMSLLGVVFMAILVVPALLRVM